MLANNRQVKSTGKNKWQQAKGQERGQRTKQGQGARGQGRKEGERIQWSRPRSWKEAANKKNGKVGKWGNSKGNKMQWGQVSKGQKRGQRKGRNEGQKANKQNSHPSKDSTLKKGLS